jgi:uncharacterized glyoxalase superfamily protein PhnB
MGLRNPLANALIVGAVDFVELRDFYRRLGWPEIVDDDGFAAFELRGIVLAIFDAARLAADANTEAEPIPKGIRFAIGVIADTANDVDELVERMRSAGATVTKEPTDAQFFAGRSAYVADPEGNFWEIAWAGADNPIVMAARRAAGENMPVGPAAVHELTGGAHGSVPSTRAELMSPISIPCSSTYGKAATTSMLASPLIMCRLR